MKNEGEKKQFIMQAIEEHKGTQEYRMAITADRYYKQDTDIRRVKKYLTKKTGEKMEDYASPNNLIPTNWYFYFTTQAIQFLLSNGINFKNEDTKKKLGKNFVSQVEKIALFAKNGGCGYGFIDDDKIEAFSYEEFVPLFDERTGELRAGIRFWALPDNKPLQITLFDEKGLQKFEKANEKDMVETLPHRGYIKITSKAPIDKNKEGDVVYKTENDRLPIVPLWNINKQSDLFGNKETIDAYEILVSNLLNNTSKSDYAYWVIKNCGAFDDEVALNLFMERIRRLQAFVMDEESEAKPYTVEIPTAATELAIKITKDQLYKDFMALNVENISASDVTATQIRAAYEPLNQKTRMFQKCVTNFINGVLDYLKIDDEPSYTIDMIANQGELIENVLSTADWMGDEFTIKKLCAIYGVSADAEEIIKQRKQTEMSRFPLDEEDET